MSIHLGLRRPRTRLVAIVATFAIAAALPAGAAAGAGPSNDDFANATVLVGNLPLTAHSNAMGASMEGAEDESPCEGQNQESVWFRFTPVNSGVFRVDTIGSDYDTNLDIYRGTTLNNLVHVDCNDDIDSWNADLYDSRIAFRGVGGTRYYFRVASDTIGEARSIDLHVRSVQAPNNDNYKAATRIASLPYNTNADIINATSAPNELRFNNCASARATRWYKYTPSVDMVIWANTFVPVDFDSTLQVFTGAKPANASFVICNDDQWVQGSNTVASGVTFKANAGTTYRFQVAGYSGESGATRELPFHVKRVTPEANDEFANAFSVEPNYHDNVNLRYTTRQAGEPTPTCVDEASNTAWYKHTATSTNALQASADATGDFDGYVAVYEVLGPGFGGLNLIGCNTFVDFIPVNGMTYAFQVTGDDARTAPSGFTLLYD